MIKLIVILSLFFTIESAFSAGFRYGGLKLDVASTTTVAGITTLTASSSQVQTFSGSSNQTVVLPDATTLNTGYWYTISNDGTGTITVRDSGTGNIATQSASMSTTYYLKATTTSIGSWSPQGRITPVVNEIYCYNTGSSGHGGTKTRYRYFNDCLATGTAIAVLSNDSTNGAQFQINQDGFYIVSYNDFNNVTGCNIAIAKNSNGTTNATALPAVNAFGASMQAAAGGQACSAGGWLKSGDILAPNDNADCSGSGPGPTQIGWKMIKIPSDGR